MRNAFKALKTVVSERVYQKKLKRQTQERKSYNRMQRGQAMGPAARSSAASFVAKGMPKPKYR